MITIKQIKAARGLLEWTQGQLSHKSGMSLASISKLERQIVSPRQFTMDVLQQTFEREGIEFIDGPGVRLTEDLFDLSILDGPKAPEQLLNDKFETLKESGEEYLLSGLDEELWDPYRDLVTFHQKRLKENKIKGRHLILEGDKNFLPYLDIETHYRWIPKSLFTQMPYYVYGDKYAVILWGPPIRIIILHNKIMAETFRRQFEMNWKMGKIPSD